MLSTAEILLLERIADKHRDLYQQTQPVLPLKKQAAPEAVEAVEVSFETLIAAEQEWFEQELEQYSWVRELEAALRERDRKFESISDRVRQIEDKSREISDQSRALRLGVERQMTEQTVMETMVAQIAENLEFYKKFPIAQKLVEQRRMDEALQTVVESLKFFRSHGNFSESEILLERFGHLKAKILSILSAEEISDSALAVLKSEIPGDPEIAEFLEEYETRFLAERAEMVRSEIFKIACSLRENAASVRSFVRKFLLEISDLCAREKDLFIRKFGESEIVQELFRGISDQLVAELHVVVEAAGEDLEKLRDIIEQIGNSSKKFPDPLRLGLGAFRSDLQERVAVISALNVRRGGGIPKTLEILSLLAGILDERTFQSVANEAVSVVLDQVSEEPELEVIGNLLLLREHVAMLECDLVVRQSEIVFPAMQDLFSASIWNILAPKISNTEIDVKAKIEDTLRAASKKFIAETVQMLLQPIVETGNIDLPVIGNLWKSRFTEILVRIRIALSIGKTENLASSAALAGPLMHEVLEACAAVDGAHSTREALKLALDEIYASVEKMGKAEISGLLSKQ